jgi:hypothetical protein
MIVEAKPEREQAALPDPETFNLEPIFDENCD